MHYFKNREAASAQFRREYQVGPRAKMSIYQAFTSTHRRMDYYIMALEVAPKHTRHLLEQKHSQGGFMYYFKNREAAIAQFRREYQVGPRAKNVDISGFCESTSDETLLYNSAEREFRITKMSAKSGAKSGGDGIPKTLETLISEHLCARKRCKPFAEPPTQTQIAGLLRLNEANSNEKCKKVGAM